MEENYEAIKRNFKNLIIPYVLVEDKACVDDYVGQELHTTLNNALIKAILKTMENLEEK